MNFFNGYSKERWIAAIGVLLFAGVTSAEVVRGLTEPVYDVSMSSIVSGRIAETFYSEGSFVEKGAIVLELESRSEQLDVQRREVLVESLKTTLQRSEMLLKNTSSISMEEVETARSEYQMALLELELAKDALLNKKIVAPFSGIVTDLPLAVGEFCEPPQIILRMVDTREFFCVANVDPSWVEDLHLEDPVIFRDSIEAESAGLKGHIVFISPIVDPASGLLRIKALFSNKDGRVRPGEGGYLEFGDGS